MILVSNLMAAGWVLLLICISGELWNASLFLLGHPTVAGLLLVQSISQYLSVSFYIALIQGFGGVSAVCVTSCRKVVTIILSFAAFAKPFTFRYIPTGALVLAGILLSVLAKQKGSKTQHTNATIVFGCCALVASVGPYVIPHV